MGGASTETALSPQWFNDSQREDRLLKPVERVWESRERWTIQTIAAFDKNNNDPEFAAIPKDPVTLYKTTKDDLTSKIVEIEDDLEDETSQALGQAQREHRSWGIKRSTGGRKVGTGIQSFMTTFSEFLESYSGIVELVKAADNQYGGLAYGTLSLFLSVSRTMSTRLYGPVND